MPRRHTLSATLSLYVVRQMLLWFGAALLALGCMILLAEIVELLRRFADTDQAPLGHVLRMAFLKAPGTVLEALPFVALAGAMGAYWQLNRFNELVAARAAGVSVWQFLLPALGVVLALGVLRVAIADPMVAAMTAEYQRLESQLRDGGLSIAAASHSGLWMREAGGDGAAIIHADRVLPGQLSLKRVSVYRFDNTDRFVGRIDAAAATYADGGWLLHDAWTTAPGTAGDFRALYAMPTSISFSDIADSFALPGTISFWRLPRYVAALEATGFGAYSHRLQYHRLLSLPLLLAGMVLLAAAVAMRPPRQGRVALMLGAGGIAGFLLYFLSYFVFKLGLNASIPLELAAWTPAGVGTMLGAALLLHLEDG